MTKLFFDVFPTLEVASDMKKLLSEMEVTKVGMNHEKDHIRIYLTGTRLIHKKNIYELEKSIGEQIFKGRQMDVKVIEKYHLSGQYTPQTLMDLYKDSMLEELKNYSLMEYNLLRSAKMEFQDDTHLLLTLENTIIAQTRSREIVEFLEKVVCERCGLNLSVELAFEEPKESKHRKNSDLQIQFEIHNIMKKVNLKNEDGEAAVSAEGENSFENIVAAPDIVQKKETEKNDAKTLKSAGNNANSGSGNFGGKKEFKKKFEGGYGGGFKKSDNPDVLYGKDFDDEPIPIEKIIGEMGEVTIRCQVMTLETREIRNEKTIVIMSVTDFTDSIVLNIFTRNDQLPELLEGVKKGAFLKIKGVTTIDKFDSELTIGSIVGIKKTADFTTMRMDTSPEKRVELHCHTKMSDMDGVSEVKDIVKRAMKWGHKAIAITDHGDVQAFPDANHALDPDDDFKVIYGVEAYLVDDLKDIITNSKDQNLDDTYVVFDLETTGFSPEKDKIIEIGAVKVENGVITDKFSTFVNPEVPIPFRIEELTSIKDDMVMDAPKIEEILPEFMEFCKGAIMVAHNAEFDMSFIIKNCERQEIENDFT
ncbi:MAG: exonuclease domain-containing protein, partial [Clostridiales bacterium]|nr:exonuclease domain-containing protein [Clostridiales bacterium]